MEAIVKAQGCFKSFFEKHSITLHLVCVLFLVLVLLIPLSMIRSTLAERMGRRDQAVSGITSSWGGEQVVVGPVLVVPYMYKIKTWKDQTVNGKQEKVEVEESAKANAFFLPAELAVEGVVTPSVLHRGIYDAVVYEGDLNISGRFAPPDFAQLGIAEEDVQWDNALLTLAVSDLRGTGDLLTIKIGDQTCEFFPGCKLNGYSSGITSKLAGASLKETSADFQMTLNLKGSKGISFAPVGQQSRVKLTSPWSAPSFNGAFLPTERAVSDTGFDASWEISWYGRGYPQQSTDRSAEICANTVTQSLLGVNFITLIDSYRMVERSIKYGVLFISLIFTAFFLFEVLAVLRIHIIQYALVGAALCLFYLAVLSLSEFAQFVYAYWAGVCASTLLIVLYSAKVLRGGRRPSIIAASLVAIYAYLYVVLQLQDYSLLFGTAGLFVVLGIVMYATRNIDWSRGE